MGEQGQSTPRRLGDDRVQVLATWGHGLAEGGRDEEIRAAGRAIMLLVEEVDALQRDLWHARAGVSSELAGGVPAETAEPATEPEPSAQAPGLFEGVGFVEALTRRLTADLPTLP